MQACSRSATVVRRYGGSAFLNPNEMNARAVFLTFIDLRGHAYEATIHRIRTGLPRLYFCLQPHFTPERFYSLSLNFFLMCAPPLSAIRQTSFAVLLESVRD